MPSLYREIPGWFDDAAAEFFAKQVAQAVEPAHFVEVGAWQGRSACAMAEAIRDSGKQIRFDSIDTWQGSEYGSTAPDKALGKLAALKTTGKTLRGEFEHNIRKRDLWPYVNPITGKSPAVADQYEDESLDFVFLDADHRAEQVEADVRAWYPKLKPCGWIGGHDWPADATCPYGVKLGVVAALNDLMGDATWLGEPPNEGSLWWCASHPDLFDPEPVAVRYPPAFPGVPRGWPYLLSGFRALGCKVTLDEAIQAEGYWSPPGKLGEPIHIAAIDVGGRRVWYDCSDFVEDWAHPSLGLCGGGEFYFKKQCATVTRMQGARPIGQYLGTQPETYLSYLPALRKLSAAPPVADACAVFSNIDERNNVPLRRQLVTRLSHRPGVWAGLWQWSDNRPEVHPSIRAEKVPFLAHLSRLAASKVCFALPGVGGDGTRTHTEVLGVGSCLLTVKGEQVYPGNWRGCWAEMERDLSDAEARLDALIADDQERQRIARLGAWYFDHELRPERMAGRILRAVTG